MKLTCDLCGGALQMNSDGQGATCTTCGLTYTIERLREMLKRNPSVQMDPPKPEPPKPVPPMPEPEKQIIYNAHDRSVVPPAPHPNPGFTFTPKQFVMSVTGIGADSVSGHIQQGGIGVGDRVFLNYDYSQPYTIRCLNDPSLPDAKAGMWVELHLKECPKRVLKKATVVTGMPNPVANAYNYPGPVSEYFTKLLHSEFSQYAIYEGVSYGALEIPVDYMFYQGGKPVMAVFLSHSRDARHDRKIGRAFRMLAQEGISCTGFYHNYRNDMSYVIDRIQKALSKAGHIDVAGQW